MFKKYLEQIGLGYLIKDLKKIEINNFVEEAFEKDVPKLSEKEIKNLYVYDVPKLSLDGSCSILEEKNDKPYDLSEIFGQSPAFTDYLWRLKQIVKNIYDLTGVDWFGIYKKTLKSNNEAVLVKLSYLGLFSRAEFPLTREFAKKSNNSTVGLKGNAIVIQNVSEHTGAYYKCDGKVQSEFCLPIYSSNSERSFTQNSSHNVRTIKNPDIVGIIDAESFPVNFFSPEKLLQIAKVAYDLGQKITRI